MSYSLEVATAANTQHCPYFTGLQPLRKNCSKILQLPVQAHGQTPSSKLPSNLPSKRPLLSLACTSNQNSFHFNANHLHPISFTFHLLFSLIWWVIFQQNYLRVDVPLLIWRRKWIKCSKCSTYDARNGTGHLDGIAAFGCAQSGHFQKKLSCW